MITSLEITNYRSIAQATVKLRPFTVLVGANGSGKSNLLKLLQDLSLKFGPGVPYAKHFAHASEQTAIEVVTPRIRRSTMNTGGFAGFPELAAVRIFSIDPLRVAGVESLQAEPTVEANGEGAVRVLDSLKTGDREDLFDLIETHLRAFVPEIEKLSLATISGQKTLQARESGIPAPIPVRELSEGTRLVLTILTIIFQERKPSIICLEDIDRGLHPALFGKLVEVCRAIAEVEGAPQIIATTQNPYFVDQFVDDEDSVIIVEKKDANTTFTTLSDRLEALGTRTDSLGAVWYSGLVGGAPLKTITHRLAK